MRTDTARGILIVGSLAITLAQGLFLILAPVFGYPIAYTASLDLLQIIVPVFLGYVGMASNFVAHGSPTAEPVQSRFLGVLIVGGLSVYGLFVTAILFAFGYLNRTSASPGQGISVALLSKELSIPLAFLAASTGVLAPRLFATRQPISPDAITKEDPNPSTHTE